jgi:hypothetical protein
VPGSRFGELDQGVGVWTQCVDFDADRVSLFSAERGRGCLNVWRV